REPFDEAVEFGHVRPAHLAVHAPVEHHQAEAVGALRGEHPAVTADQCDVEDRYRLSRLEHVRLLWEGNQDRPGDVPPQAPASTLPATVGDCGPAILAIRCRVSCGVLPLPPDRPPPGPGDPAMRVFGGRGVWSCRIR